MRDDISRRALVQYSLTAQRAAGTVIRRYSTSFYNATRLLGRRNREHVRSIYALVRVADELVDGVASAAGVDRAAQLEALDRYEAQTLSALRSGFSTDLIVHAFAHTALVCGIEPELIRPFFASMRTDIALGATAPSQPPRPEVYDEAAHREYVYGSAEVVGLMCLRVFLRGRSVDPEQMRVLERGARQLGAALQNINFLRDIGDDTRVLGRHYLGTLTALSEHEKDRWVAIARAQLDEAQEAIALLPLDAARAVAAAHALFGELLTLIDAADCESLHRARIRVPDAVKARILVQTLVLKPRTGA